MADQPAGRCIRNVANDICNPVAENQSYLCIQKRTNKNAKICLKIIIITENRKSENGKQKAAIAIATKGTMSIITTRMPAIATAIAIATKGIVTTTKSRRAASWRSL